MKLSDWIPDPDSPHAYMRIVEGSDPKLIKNRIAFIEKTPRVRISPHQYATERNGYSHYNPESQANIWVSGPKGSGELCGKDPQSRAWCDQMLVLLGYEI